MASAQAAAQQENVLVEGVILESARAAALASGADSMEAALTAGEAIDAHRAAQASPTSIVTETVPAGDAGAAAATAPLPTPASAPNSSAALPATTAPPLAAEATFRDRQQREAQMKRIATQQPPPPPGSAFHTAHMRDIADSHLPSVGGGRRQKVERRRRSELAGLSAPHH